MRAQFKQINLVAAALIATAAFSFAPAVAAAADGIAGSWRGTGSVMLPSGATEKARCKVSFSRQGGRAYAMNAVCASSSARVAQTAELRQVGANRFAGEFVNTEYGVTGNISVTQSGDSLSARLEGGGGSAQFHLSR